MSLWKILITSLYIYFFISVLMKKYLVLALFCLFWLLQTQTAYWTVAPLFPYYYQDSCSMMTDVNSVDWYKLVLVSWFSWYVEEVKPFTCLKWFIFLVPEDLDIDSIKTIEWPEENRKNFPSHYKYYFDPWPRNYSWFFWTNFLRALENEDTKLVWKLYGVNSKYWRQFKFSHSLDLYKLELQDDWELWLENYFSLWYDYKYVYYVIWWIIVLWWIVWLFRMKIKIKKTK